MFRAAFTSRCTDAARHGADADFPRGGAAAGPGIPPVRKGGGGVGGGLTVNGHSQGGLRQINALAGRMSHLRRPPLVDRVRGDPSSPDRVLEADVDQRADLVLYEEKLMAP
ncbi:hypothetical protein BDK51DRAFT_30237 [Blyttiomyces helicus]|uniref:Uncharacterized protein n=1 Tax=Blyttiomyces helicus TaxID=388810 RepID=A0A4P9WPV2_9FUNG|nr:hypothetical protein BDK51DRAFT_30237 [Blyttiomyces helicus]|eukprot:RKO92856.1 hypothetical protein BDK51DRAFT_30237 [Blyttiomyces helicus]